MEPPCQSSGQNLRLWGLLDSIHGIANNLSLRVIPIHTQLLETYEEAEIAHHKGGIFEVIKGGLRNSFKISSSISYLFAWFIHCLNHFHTLKQILFAASWAPDNEMLEYTSIAWSKCVRGSYFAAIASLWVCMIPNTFHSILISSCLKRTITYSSPSFERNMFLQFSSFSIMLAKVPKTTSFVPWLSLLFAWVFSNLANQLSWLNYLFLTPAHISRPSYLLSSDVVFGFVCKKSYQLIFHIIAFCENTK